MNDINNIEKLQGQYKNQKSEFNNIYTNSNRSGTVLVPSHSKSAFNKIRASSGNHIKPPTMMDLISCGGGSANSLKSYNAKIIHTPSSVDK